MEVLLYFNFPICAERNSGTAGLEYDQSVVWQRQELGRYCIEDLFGLRNLEVVLDISGSPGPRVKAGNLVFQILDRFDLRCAIFGRGKWTTRDLDGDGEVSVGEA